MSRQKIELLRSAWRRGLTAFMKQIALEARDSLWSSRHLVYSIDISQKNRVKAVEIEKVIFRRIYHWNEVRSEDIEYLKKKKKDIRGWGEFEWLEELDYGLWIAEINGKLAAFKWWLNRDQAKASNFFVEIPEGAELGGQGTVLPEFRGKRLHDRILVSIQAYRASQGINTFFETVRDYNFTSRRAMARVDFTYLGYAEVMKRTGVVRWHPLPNPISAASLEGME